MDELILKRTRMPRVPPRRVALPVTLLVFCVGLTAVFWATYSFFVGSPRGQRIDDAALVGALHFMNADTKRRQALDFMDAMPAICAGVAVLGLILMAFRGRRLMPPVIAAAAMAGAALSSQLLKHGILERPNHGISAATMNSFPSGHTTLAAAAMFTVLLIAPPAYRAWVTVFGGGFAAIAGAATLLLGWHRPSDVLAAYLVAAFWAALGAAGLGFWSDRANVCPKAVPVAVPLLGPVPRLLAVLGTLGTGIGTTLWLVIPTGGLVAGHENRYLLVLAATLMLLLSMAMILTVALQWLLIRYRIDAGVRPGRERGMK